MKIESGNTVILKNDRVNKFGLIRRGTVHATAEGCMIVLSAGDIVGILEGCIGSYSFDYVVGEDAEIDFFTFENQVQYEAIFIQKPELGYIAFKSVMQQLSRLYGIYKELETEVSACYDFLTETYDRYKTICSESNTAVREITKLERMLKFESTLGSSINTLRYVKIMAGIPEEQLKALFAADGFIACYQIQDIISVTRHLIRGCNMLADELEENAVFLCADGEANLFHIQMELLKVRTVKYSSVREILACMKEEVIKICNMEKLLQGKCNRDKSLQSEKYLEIFENILAFYESPTQTVANAVVNTVANTKEKEKVSDTFEKLLAYAKLSDDKVAEYSELLEKYRELKNKSSMMEEARLIRKHVTEMFFDLYEEVFFISLRVKEQELPLYIRLFLDYGLLDEKLISEECLEELIDFEESEEEEDGIVKVYTLNTWLRMIATNKKMPSKNEFNIDYEAQLREIKKKEEMTKEQEKAYLIDYVRKVKYEIENMFRMNSKIVFGKITTFCPVLRQGEMTESLVEMLLTKKRICRAVEKVISIDYSVFHRDFMYDNRDAGLNNLIINKKVLPEFILLPCFGENGSMWQEIAGRKRDTPGRFILPQLFKGDLYSVIVRMCGIFRWEMCKTMQGSYWNDIKERSLTSEYNDYVQFYKKNKGLSDQMKEKLSMQLQKCRNSFREVFVHDYMVWINSESQGAIRLNKLVRDILYTYCPFSKPIRQRLASNPIFEEAAKRFELKRAKKMKEYGLRQTSIASSGKEDPEELLEEIRFYDEY